MWFGGTHDCDYTANTCPVKISPYEFRHDPNELYCPFWNVVLNNWGIIQYHNILRLPQLGGPEELFDFTGLKNEGNLVTLNIYDLFHVLNGKNYIRMGANLGDAA